MSGLARTTGGASPGTPSWALTRTLAGVDLDTFLQEQQDRYGLSDLEIIRILSTALHERTGFAVRDEQAASYVRGQGLSARLECAA